MTKDNDGKDLLMKVLTPREIVSELDKYIIGQHQAKRSVAIALRNRWRRQQVPRELRDEILVIQEQNKDRSSAIEIVSDIKIEKPAPSKTASIFLYIKLH